METAKLKKFAQYARRSLIEQVGSKLAQVIKEESTERRELPNVVAKLESQLKQKGKEQLIEQAAYTWFNRFCALRFMDVNQYNRIMVLSPLEGQFQSEILAEAKAGHIDDSVVNDKTREKIFGLLNGSIKSRDGQSEAYRLLIVAVCNDYHRIMPYLFERIEDYMELLMPDDLLSGNSILAYTREAMTPEACESVECIGWLYQFYISEKKDQVFEGLKKNKKIAPENIPAATQLFTPDWIVRYLVENSLGRLWMLNNPSSKVIEQMDYYIKPVEEETDFLKIRSPEEIKVCDPACGSGHMLTYAYDLLYAIYLDAEYDPVDIPELILTKNLYGIEIDERAAELAAFALSIKAIKGDPKAEGNNRRRFFRNPIKPNICRLENITFNDNELNEYFDFVGRDLFTQDLRTTLKEFEEADNFGSLIQPTLKNAKDVRSALEAKDVSGQLFLAEIHQRVLRIIDQADFLSPKYHVVVANPPYMGSKGMNSRMAEWLKDTYSDVKSDLFSAFMVRNTFLALEKGQLGFMTPFVWMFLSSYEKLRKFIIDNKTLTSLIQLEYSGFSGATVPICTFTFENTHKPSYCGGYIRLSDFKGSENQSPKVLEAIQNPSCKWFYRAPASSFNNIPGRQIVYWISESLTKTFMTNGKMKNFCHAFQGIITGNNDYFLRYWFEIENCKIKNDFQSFQDAKEKVSWIPYNKGGNFRKWSGNNIHVLRWNGFGDDLTRGRTENRGYFFKEGLSWSDITSSKSSFRLSGKGMLFDAKGPTAFYEKQDIAYFLGLMNSKYAEILIDILNPTLSFQIEDFYNIPVSEKLFQSDRVKAIVDSCVSLSSRDWNRHETSWGFSRSPFLEGTSKPKLIKTCYEKLRTAWCYEVTLLQQLEEENNQIIRDIYGLEGEIDTKVPTKEISLYSNPKYRYSGSNTTEDLEGKLLADTVFEFISYAVGCLFGRYSLDVEGLILANQGDTLERYLEKIPVPTFRPDENNVIPLIDFDGSWFEDDISERFKEFLKVTFGEEHFIENLAFVEQALGKDIKRYFVKDFYADHVQYYKKRPIYWLFSSPKGTFNALIYIHRYRSDTVSVVLNDYLREFRTKLQARKESYEQVGVSASASQKDKTDAIKAINKINKALDEVNDYERDILYPLAGQKIEIDLDDGVKANYPKFGKALKNITGLS